MLFKYVCYIFPSRIRAMMKRDVAACVFGLAVAGFAAREFYVRFTRKRFSLLSPKLPGERGLRKRDLPAEADVVLVGAGPANLALGVLLTRRGYSVLLLEAHDRIGGGLHTFKNLGHSFETGFHYSGELSKSHELGKIVSSLTGGNVSFSALHRINGAYDALRVGTTNDDLVLFQRSERFVDDLVRQFPHEREALEAYQADLDAIAPRFLPFAIWRSLDPSSWMRRATRALFADPMTRFTSRTARRGLADCGVRDPKLVTLLSYISMGCVGMPPSQTNYGLFTGLHNHFCAGGAFYPVGGPSKIALELCREFERDPTKAITFVRCPVDEILVNSYSNAVEGVAVRCSDGEIKRVSARIVVSSAGLEFTSRELLRSFPNPIADRLRDQGIVHSKGHVYLFVGLDGNSKDLELPSHNEWLVTSEDVEEAWRNDVGYFGVSFPSAKDEKRFVCGTKSQVVVLAGDVDVAPFLDAPSEDAYLALKRRYQDMLLTHLLSLYPHLESRIECVECGTPRTTKTYLNKHLGHSYSLRADVAKSRADVDWIGPRISDAPDGLYFSGADIAGVGFAPAIVSALQASAAIDGFSAWFDAVPMLLK